MKKLLLFLTILMGVSGWAQIADGEPQNGLAYYYRPTGTFYQSISTSGPFNYLVNPPMVMRPYSSVTYKAREARSYEWTYQQDGNWHTTTGNQNLDVTYGCEIDSVPKLKTAAGNTYYTGTYDMYTGKHLWCNVHAVPDPVTFMGPDSIGGSYFVSPKWFGGGTRDSGSGFPYRQFTFRETDSIGNYTYHSHMGKNSWGFDSVSLWVEKPLAPYLLRNLYIVHDNLLITNDCVTYIDVIVRNASKDYETDMMTPGRELSRTQFAIDSSLVLWHDVLLPHVDDPVTGNVIYYDTVMTYIGSQGILVPLPEPVIVDDELLITLTGYNNDDIDIFSLRANNDTWNEGFGDHCYVFLNNENQLEEKGWNPLNKVYGAYDADRVYHRFLVGCSLAPSIFMGVKFPYTMLRDEDDTGVRQVGAAGGKVAVALKSSDPGSEQQVTVESTTPGSDDVSWLTVGFTDGEVSELGEHSLTADLDVAPNTAGTPRSARVTITMPASPTVTLLVNQTNGMVADVTGDGQVDIADVNAVINIMLGKGGLTPDPSPGGEGSPADVTGDGEVDIADVNAVINIMLGKL